MPLYNIDKYHINHDMSKPYIVEYDECNKPHYPNHSYRSYELYCERFGYDEYAELIKYDMGFHTYKGEELESLVRLPFSHHLYASAWAELFANAELFGGCESDSFKIKRKKLIKAFKMLTRCK